MTELPTPTILSRIVARKQQEVSDRQSALSLDEVRCRAQDTAAPRGFEQALQKRITRGQSGVIAEIKKASPSKGVIRENFDPESIAASYAASGAACLSVLTDVDFFQGEDRYLQMARETSGLPALRKDFMIDPWQIYESRMLGADCILLIAACLETSRMQELAGIASELRMDVLLEVHDASELHRALEVETGMIGINNRNLHTFDVSLDTTFSLLAEIPTHRLVVTESGISSREDVTAMRDRGVAAFLVGERFMRDPDPGSALAALFGTEPQRVP